MSTMLVSPSLQHPVLNRLKGLVRVGPAFDDPAVATPEAAEARCREVGQDLVIVLLAADHLEQLLDIIPRLRESDAKHLLAVGPATDPKLILRAMQVGADLFLDQSELESELTAALSGSAAGRTPAGRPGG